MGNGGRKNILANLRIAATLLRHGHILELAQSAYAGFQDAETNQEKAPGGFPAAARSGCHFRRTHRQEPARDFDETRDYVGELERKFTLRTVLDFLVRLSGEYANWQAVLMTSRANSPADYPSWRTRITRGANVGRLFSAHIGINFAGSSNALRGCINDAKDLMRAFFWHDGSAA